MFKITYILNIPTQFSAVYLFLQDERVRILKESIILYLIFIDSLVLIDIAQSHSS